MAKRLSKVKISWNTDFAYAIGLIVTDGNLSKDGRHMNMTSKDLEMIDNFKKCLGLNNKVGRKSRSDSKDKKYFQVQFGDRNFYDFLLSLGITPTKSKTIGALAIPDLYFADFLRGCIDGDGSIVVTKHPESKHPQLRARVYSASLDFIKWLKKKIETNTRIKKGYIGHPGSVYVVSYGKADSIKILKFIYYKGVNFYLKRKYDIAKAFLNK